MSGGYPSMDEKEKLTTMQTYRIAAIPADGIGLEVLPAGIEVLKTLETVTGTFQMTFETFPWGCNYYHAQWGNDAGGGPGNPEGL